MIPSQKRLEQVFPGKGKILRKLLTSDAAVKSHPAASTRRAECYHPPSVHDHRLHALNAETCGHGVEYIRHKNDGYRIGDMRGLEYINHGDPYVTTIIFDCDRGTWRLCCWGGIVESRNCYE